MDSQDGTPVPPGGARPTLGDHWDPSNPRDLATISRFAKEQPRAFAAHAADAESVAHEMMRLSAQCAREAKAAALDVDELVGAGKLAAASGKLAMDIRRTNMQDQHHADDVARGAGEGSKYQTIVLQGADPARLLMPPPREP